MFRRISCAVLVPVSVLIGGGTGCREASRHPPPNLLIVTIDTLRADRLSQYGYDLPTCTALDAFAADATVFTEAYAPSPWTLPSTASLLTGLAAGRQKVWIAGGAIPRELDTLAEVLRHHEWRTIGLSANIGISRFAQFDQGFEVFHEHTGSNLEYPDIAELRRTAVEWLDRRTDEPFFMYLHPMNVHGPYLVPSERAADLLGRPPVGGFRYRGPLMKSIQAGADVDLPPGYRTSLEEQYDTAVRYTCGEVAGLLRAFEERGLYDDTLIVVTADHGEELFDHDCVGHGQSLHQELVHVPLMIKLPGQRSGRVVAARATLTDLFPTVLERLGLEPPRPVDGRSLLPLLEDSAAAPAEEDVILFGNFEGRMLGRGILSGAYKLVEIDSDYRGVHDARRLYDVAADPHETHDLTAERPAVVEDLARRLAERFAGYARNPLPEPPDIGDRIDPDVLRSLGYLQ